MLEKIERARQASHKASASLATENVADFIEAHMIIPETKQALTLHPEQRAVLEAMNERDAVGNLRNALWLYSAPKKSAKTTIIAGVALWQAWRIPHGEIYIIGNDQKQADNRMPEAIRFAIQHNPAMEGRARITKSSYRIDLDNGTRIEAVPVDPRGEAGMNPTGLFWTETWGAIGDRAEMMWSEATLSPTRAGQSLKVVESYAGYTGTSLILERLYEAIVKGGAPDPDIPELYRSGSSIAYWCTRRYLEWQTNAAAQAYYAQQALEKTPSEFRRQHHNEWQSSTEVFVDPSLWNACWIPPEDRAAFALKKADSLVIGIDAGISSDCFAIVAVSRRQDNVFVQYAKCWYPPKGGKIQFGDKDTPDTPVYELHRLSRSYSVIQFCYDPTQLEKLAQDLNTEGLGWFKEVTQTSERPIGDKMLYDAIIQRTLKHQGHPDLTEHIQNANRKAEGDNKLRIIKRTDVLKIDLAVALSMALYRAYEVLPG